MIIDAHAHLDPHEITGDDYIRLMDASGIDKVVLLASLRRLDARHLKYARGWTTDGRCLTFTT